MDYNSGYMMGGMHGLWWLFWLALLGVFLFAGWGGRRNRAGGPQRDTPHEVLHRRLASGEITAADYEERKLLLDRDAGSSHGKTEYAQP